MGWPWRRLVSGCTFLRRWFVIGGESRRRTSTNPCVARCMTWTTTISTWLNWLRLVLPSRTPIWWHSWEEFSDFDATYSTFNRYVKNLRVQAGLSQPKRIRCIRDDQPPGYEAQVDFGEYRMRNMYGKETKVYFFCMVLSYSRMKFVYFSPKPFTAKTAIEVQNYVQT